MSMKIAIIGDNFMLPEVFDQQIQLSCKGLVSTRCSTNNWPDEPMEHGYAVEGMDGLKEYFGQADEVVEFIDDAEILVTHLAPVSRSMFERLPNLKMVAVSRGGPVNIDLKSAHERGVLVVNTPGRNASAVAEFTLGGILAETRKIRVGHEGLRAGRWRGDLYRSDVTGRELNELTVGVIGYGNIGTKVVKLLLAFGATVLVHDPYIQLDPTDLAAGVQLVSFDHLLSEADVVTLHSRVTEETRHSMCTASFAKMKPGALFVNTARGPLCDYDALYHALTEGTLGSAMLETFAVEPVPDDWPLTQLDNVTMTPHIAGASLRTVTYAAELVAEEIRRYIAGEAPCNRC